MGSVVLAHGLSCFAAMWDLPEPRLEPVSLHGQADS